MVAAAGGKGGRAAAAATGAVAAAGRGEAGAGAAAGTGTGAVARAAAAPGATPTTPATLEAAVSATADTEPALAAGDCCTCSSSTGPTLKSAATLSFSRCCCIWLAKALPLPLPSIADPTIPCAGMTSSACAAAGVTCLRLVLARLTATAAPAGRTRPFPASSPVIWLPTAGLPPPVSVTSLPFLTVATPSLPFPVVPLSPVLRLSPPPPSNPAPEASCHHRLVSSSGWDCHPACSSAYTSRPAAPPRRFKSPALNLPAASAYSSEGCLPRGESSWDFRDCLKRDEME